MSDKRRKNKKSTANKRPVWKTALICVLSVIMLASGCGMIYFYSIINSINYASVDNKNNKEKETSPSSLTGSGDTSLDLFDGTLLNDPMILNIMVYGEDSGVDSTTDYGRSDTMIMVSIDNRHKQVKLSSFMRDMLVPIPYTDDAGNSHGLAKLNAAYSLGGAELSVKTIESNFGVDIDRYAIVNFNSFKGIIDALGGIDINLTQDEIDYINWQTYINGQSEERYELQVEPGLVHLNGRDRKSVV